MESNQFKCPMCGATFNSQEELNAHAGQVHQNNGQTQQGPQEYSITCSKCGFKAKNTAQMEEHGKMHQPGGQM